VDYWSVHGGIAGLAQVLRTDFEALEADFTRYYNEDLRALCWGDNPWGVRRLLAHIRGLPPDSAWVRHRAGEFAGWSNDTEMLAASVDLLQSLVRVTIAAHGGDAPDFKPMPRPYKLDFEPEPEQTISASELSSFLKGF